MISLHWLASSFLVHTLHFSIRAGMEVLGISDGVTDTNKIAGLGKIWWVGYGWIWGLLSDLLRKPIFTTSDDTTTEQNTNSLGHDSPFRHPSEPVLDLDTF